MEQSVRMIMFNDLKTLKTYHGGCRWIRFLTKIKYVLLGQLHHRKRKNFGCRRNNSTTFSGKGVIIIFVMLVEQRCAIFSMKVKHAPKNCLALLNIYQCLKTEG